MNYFAHKRRSLDSAEIGNLLIFLIGQELFLADIL